MHWTLFNQNGIHISRDYSNHVYVNFSVAASCTSLREFSLIESRRNSYDKNCCRLVLLGGSVTA